MLLQFVILTMETMWVFFFTDLCLTTTMWEPIEFLNSVKLYNFIYIYIYKDKSPLPQVEQA